MADTIPDVLLKGVEYEDIYALTGITVSSSISIQSKALGGVYVQVSSTQPNANSKDGYLLMPNQSCLIDGTISKVWAIGKCAISVQEVDS